MRNILIALALAGPLPAADIPPPPPPRDFPPPILLPAGKDFSITDFGKGSRVVTQCQTIIVESNGFRTQHG